MQMTCVGSDVKVRKAKELGYSDEQLDKMLSGVDIPLDASALDKVAGGLPRPLPPTVDEAERGLI